MGLKINTEVSTDRGITNEGYLYIDNYRLNVDSGTVMMKVKFFLSKEERFTGNEECNNYLIKSNYTYRFPKVAFEGNLVRYDFGEMIEQSLYEFSYGYLKEQLGEHFGKENIEDVFEIEKDEEN